MPLSETLRFFAIEKKRSKPPSSWPNYGSIHELEVMNDVPLLIFYLA